MPEVYHFPLPEAFRDPVFRPSRTGHVVFDREVFQRVRDEGLGTVRGQPIRPVLAGFGEPVTDWLLPRPAGPVSLEAPGAVGRTGRAPSRSAFAGHRAQSANQVCSRDEPGSTAAITTR